MPESLSKREKEVLELLADGMTTPEISKQLHISTKTVDCHRANMLEKTQSRNVAQLVANAFRKGILSLGL